MADDDLALKIRSIQDQIDAEDMDDPRSDKMKRYLYNLIVFIGNIGKACRATGVSRRFGEKHRAESAIFAELEESVIEDVIDLAEEKLFEKVEEGHFPAIQFILKTKGRKRGYGDKVEVDNKVSMTNFDQMLIESRERRLKEIESESKSEGGTPLLIHEGRSIPDEVQGPGSFGQRDASEEPITPEIVN